MNSSVEPSNITSSITLAVNDKHPPPKQPKLADKDIEQSSANVTVDRAIMESPEQPPKVIPTKSKKSRTMKKKASTAVDDRGEHPPSMASKTAPLSIKTCNSTQGNSLEEDLKEGAMKEPDMSSTLFSATVELVDLFSEPSSQESQADAPKKSPKLTGGVAIVKIPQNAVGKHHNLNKSSPTRASEEDEIPTVLPKNSKQKKKQGKKKWTESRGGVPLVQVPQITPVECHSPQTVNVVDTNGLSSHQGLSAGPSHNAQIKASSSKGKKRLDEKPSDLAVQAPAVASLQTAPMKPRSPRKLIPINEDAHSVLGESSTPALQIPQKSSSRSKRRKGDEKNSPQPDRWVQSFEDHQTSSAPAARAKIAKSLAQVFAAHQRLVTRNRSHKHKGGAKEKEFPFLRLPQELRDMIIDYTIDYDGIDPALVKINSTFPSTYIRSPKFNKKVQKWMTELDEVQFRSTPTILCLNRQIYEEAQDMLRKRTLRISHPPQYPIKGIYDLSHVISDEALSKISKIQFELHTYAATERRHDIMQTDWKGKSMYKDECLADSYPWATLLKDCFQVWRGTQDPRYLELSIDHCSGERSQYNLAVFGHKVCPYGLFV